MHESNLQLELAAELGHVAGGMVEVYLEKKRVVWLVNNYYLIIILISKNLPYMHTKLDDLQHRDNAYFTSCTVRREE